jgi:hypothetical protein
MVSVKNLDWDDDQEKMGILARPAKQKSRLWRTLRTCSVISANTLGYLLKLHF